MTVHKTSFEITTSKHGLSNVTEQVISALKISKVMQGKCVVSVSTRACSLMIQDNSNPQKQIDTKSLFARLVPPEDGAEMDYHLPVLENGEEIPAEIKEILMQNSITIGIIDGHLSLGHWEKIYLFEHMNMPQKREITVQIAL